MYTKGEYVFCGNTGICQIDGITTLELDGIDSGRQYYLMHPVYSDKSTIYKPIDSAATAIRPALTKKEAENLISQIDNIDPLIIESEKEIEKTYKESIRSNDPKALISLIKTINNRKEIRMQKGFKMTAMDTRFIKIAEDFLYGELSISLDMNKVDIKEHLKELI